jgi:hypothetical protein
MSGLLVSVKNFPGIKVTTDKNGILKFQFHLIMKYKFKQVILEKK